MPHPYLTVHTLTALPWHNLNRDENGAPKQVVEGGVTRARLSSQSLKRAARIAFERDCEQAVASVRTKHATSVIVDRVEEIRGQKLAKQKRTDMERSVATRVNYLTRSSESTGKKDTMVWLSAGEIEQVAQAFAAGHEEDPVQGPATDSLAIAAFGRMFAAAQHLAIPSAVSVGDSITTHAAAIELDWFAAQDDSVTDRNHSSQLGFTMQTTGVYYRSFTFDRTQLAKNFTVPLSSPEAEVQLRSLVRHLTLALPTGRSSGTAAQTLPALIIAEEQAHRVAYDFHEPVRQDAEGGFLAPSIQALLNKAADARAFDPDLFGEECFSGTEVRKHLRSVVTGTMAQYTDFVVDFLRR